MAKNVQQTLTQMQFIDKPKRTTNVVKLIKKQKFTQKIKQNKCSTKKLATKPTPEPPSTIDWTQFQKLNQKKCKIHKKIEDVLPLKPSKDFFD